ncbi:hypothetical protein RR48_03734 [Papilio machaon]|uniref:Uncharacterized protein n=1 Tax=Papilio machaon TaxID=76193 RepID=A0A0N1PGW9_PAPMA|nr:hypothetical protein RR48_03734 [Papilio machaon]
MPDLDPFDIIHPDCVTCCDNIEKSKRIQYANEARDYMNACVTKNKTLPSHIVNLVDKDVETCRKKQSSDDNEELRRRAFALYKNYVEGRKEGGKCPTKKGAGREIADMYLKHPGNESSSDEEGTETGVIEGTSIQNCKEDIVRRRYI